MRSVMLLYSIHCRSRCRNDGRRCGFCPDTQGSGYGKGTSEFAGEKGVHETREAMSK